MILRQARRRNGYPATAGRALYDPRHGEACVVALTGEIAGAWRLAYQGAAIDRGPSGYLSYPDDASLEYRDGQSLMAECWVYVDSYPAAPAALFCKGGNPGNQPNWCVLFQPSGVLTGLVGASSFYFAMACDTAAVPLKAWLHVRLTIGSNTLRLFIDGVLSASAGGTGAQVDAQPLTIGGGSGYATFPGAIDGARVCKGGSYDTATFTPPGAPAAWTADTLLLVTSGAGRSVPLGIDTTIVNRASQTGKHIAVQGAVVTSPVQARFGAGSLSCGAGGYLEIPHHTDFDYADGQKLSVEAWVYLTALPSSGEALILSKGGVVNDQGNWQVFITAAGAVGATVGASLYFVAFTTTTAAGAVPVGVWTHIRMTIMANTLRLFINGALSASVAGTGAETDTQPLYIGGRGAAFPGFIDGVCIRKGGTYDTASFTPPTAAPALTADTVLLLNFDGATAGAPMEGIRWVPSGSGVAVSGVQARDYPTSLRFAGGYLQHPPSAVWNLAGTDWTIKAVVRWDGSAGGLWSRRNNQAGHGACGGILADGRIFLSGVWNGAWRDPWLASATAVTPNVWTPIAWVRRGTSVSIAINGAESVSGTLTAEPADQPSIPFAVGAGGSYGESPFVGWVQDFVFLRGVGEGAAELVQATPYRDRIRRPPGVVTLMR